MGWSEKPMFTVGGLDVIAVAAGRVGRRSAGGGSDLGRVKGRTVDLQFHGARHRQVRVAGVVGALKVGLVRRVTTRAPAGDLSLASLARGDVLGHYLVGFCAEPVAGRRFHRRRAGGQGYDGQ
jgi:hypothetical protein